jgi:hypothetical protein
VIASGVLLFFLGLLLILELPIAGCYKVLIAVVWLGLSAFEWLSNRRAYAQNGILRIDAEGRVEWWDDDAGRRELGLRPGSVVLSRLAWLRLSAGDGLRYAELLRGDARESDDWRRFQVIWRHVGASR